MTLRGLTRRGLLTGAAAIAAHEALAAGIGGTVTPQIGGGIGPGASDGGPLGGVKSVVQRPKILIGWGDSLGVGIDARDPAIDLDWPNVRQVRQRAPAGISADISPLDQAIAPHGHRLSIVLRIFR